MSFPQQDGREYPADRTTVQSRRTTGLLDMGLPDRRNRLDPDRDQFSRHHRKNRAPTMRLMQMPLFVWTTVTTMVLVVCAFPVLTATLAMLTLDRYLGMHLFTNTLGGNLMMYVNLFWTWGTPRFIS